MARASICFTNRRSTKLGYATLEAIEKKTKA